MTSKGDIGNPFDPAYLVTLDEIYHSHWCAAKRQRIRLLESAFRQFWPGGHPTSLIHVTGTNGKGSVIYYLEQGLRSTGPVGAWNGPHLFDYRERFHINSQPVTSAEVVDIYRQKILPLQDRLGAEHPGHSLSFAEIGILISLHLFDRHRVKWGMMEVGAGGRYTPLMGLEMTACVLTNVGSDHTKTLGSEMWQRALEKAGIARHGVPFFTAARGDSLFFVRKAVLAEGGEFFPLTGAEEKEVARMIPDAPTFKIRNIALAVKTIRHFYPDFQFFPSLFQGDMQGRFWQVAPNIIADVSHNSDKVRHFIDYLKSRYPGRKFRFIVGLTRKRQADRVLAPLLDIAEHVVITSASYAGRDPIEIFSEMKKKGFTNLEIIADPVKAYNREKETMRDQDILVLTGSAYMIEQALNPNPYIKHLNRTYGRRYR